MRAVLVYWIIGCVLIGLAYGQMITECPKDKMPTSDMVGAISIWPAFFAAAIARTGKPPLPQRVCEAAP
jgi:hypothetical protein